MQDFHPWIVPGHESDMRSAAGHLPYLTTADAFYLPGHLRETPVLLRFSDPKTFAPLVLEDGTYCVDNVGRLLFSTQGRILAYERGVPVLIQGDDQIQGDQCAFVTDELAIGFVKRGGGAKAVRFYHEGKRQDFSEVQLGYRVSTMGFYALGDALALAFLADQDLRVAVWDL
jgi:hypothetical protein